MLRRNQPRGKYKKTPSSERAFLRVSSVQQPFSEMRIKKCADISRRTKNAQLICRQTNFKFLYTEVRRIERTFLPKDKKRPQRIEILIQFVWHNYYTTK